MLITIIYIINNCENMVNDSITRNDGQGSSPYEEKNLFYCKSMSTRRLARLMPGGEVSHTISPFLFFVLI